MPKLGFDCAKPSLRVFCLASLCIVSMMATAVPLCAQDTASLKQRIRAVAQEEGFDAPTVFAIITIESAFDTTAISRDGNVGLMQLFPATAQSVIPGTRRAQLFNPETNVRIGLRYLRSLMNRYGGDLEKGLRAYKNGPRAVDRGGGRSPASNRYIDRFFTLQARFMEAAIVAQGNTSTVRQIAEEYAAALDSINTNRPDRWPDNSAAARAALSAKQDALLARLQRVDTTRIEIETERLLFLTVSELLNAAVDIRSCAYPLWNVDPVQGWQVHAFPRDAREQNIGTSAARRAALTRWRAAPRFVAGEIANLRTGLDSGIVAPAVLVTEVIAQVDALLSSPLETLSLYDPARRDTADAAFRVAFGRVIRAEVLPALQRYRNFLAAEYLPHARTTVGLSGHPRGDACWRASIRRTTTMPMDPDSLAALARSQLARYAPARDSVARTQYGLPDGRALSSMLETDPALAFGSRAEAMDTARSLMLQASRLLPQYFGRLPSPLLPELDTATISTGLPGFYRAAGEAGRARVILNPRDFERAPARRLLTPVLLHESVPGHHLQVALAPDDTPLDRLLSRLGYNAAFGEGWASYAAGELAREMGLGVGRLTDADFADDAVNNAVSLLVASGLHGDGWSIEQAVDTLAVYSAAPRDILREGALFMAAVPGLSLAYPLGRAELVRLRAYAEAEHGQAFDVRAFHDRVLEHGMLPLAVLRGRIESWRPAR